MHTPEHIALLDGLRALSLAVDLAMGRRYPHAQAVAVLSAGIGAELDVGSTEVEELVLAALLKDAG